MDIAKTIDDISRIEESKDYKEQDPHALKLKEELDAKISRFIWE